MSGYAVASTCNGRRSYHLFKDESEAVTCSLGEEEEVLIRPVNLEDVFIKLTGQRLSP